jgi:hypothetical protein
MKLWKISQTRNNNYDTWDAAVVAALSSDAAKLIHPSGAETNYVPGYGDKYGGWAHPDNVTVEYIGEARIGMLAGVIVASFNAG